MGGRGSRSASGGGMTYEQALRTPVTASLKEAKAAYEAVMRKRDSADVLKIGNVTDEQRERMTKAANLAGEKVFGNLGHAEFRYTTPGFLGRDISATFLMPGGDYVDVLVSHHAGEAEMRGAAARAYKIGLQREKTRQQNEAYRRAVGDKAYYETVRRHIDEQRAEYERRMQGA